MAIPGTSPHVAPSGNVSQPVTRRHGAPPSRCTLRRPRALPDAEIAEQNSTIPAAARSFLMGCIIDWTGVLKAPQIAGAAAIKNWRFQAKKPHHGLHDPRRYCGKAFEVTAGTAM